MYEHRHVDALIEAAMALLKSAEPKFESATKSVDGVLLDRLSEALIPLGY